MVLLINFLVVDEVVSCEFCFKQFLVGFVEVGVNYGGLVCNFGMVDYCGEVEDVQVGVLVGFEGFGVGQEGVDEGGWFKGVVIDFVDFFVLQDLCEDVVCFFEYVCFLVGFVEEGGVG